VRARYDSAQTTDENIRHWVNADNISAKFTNLPNVRYNLRNRARYEVANNSYAAGIVATIAQDIIGTGPRLQLLSDDEAENSRIEAEWAQWVRAVHLPARLTTMRRSLAVDGEAFCMMISNPRVEDFTPVQLDLRLIEADQVATPWFNPVDPLATDGICYDEHMNPLRYSILKRHPGDFYQIGLVADWYDARRIIHWFHVDRPGELRGVPELTPALPLFAQLRRYTLAVLAAAETAADFAAILYSEMPPDGEAADSVPFDTVPIERRMMMTLPGGWKMSQFRPEQPSQQYSDFKHELIAEISRALLIPKSLALGDSADLNYSSGRLDHQVYHRNVQITRSEIEVRILDRLFAAWLNEMSLATDLIAGGPDRLEGFPHIWYWDGFGHVDPQKEALAQQTRLQNHTTTYAEEYAKAGRDWKAQLIQRGRELALMGELGLPLSWAPQPTEPPEEQPEPTTPAVPPSNGKSNGGDDDENGKND
jgi:lambda family phage portal protein